MRLSAYCDLVYDLINSRKDLDVEWLNIEFLKGRRKAVVEGRVCFWDGSLLRFQEELVQRGSTIFRNEYAYHYQAADGALLFRYDNSPHYPDIETFPHHKHVRAGASELVTPARPPDLIGVLREIETMLAARQE